MSEPSSPKNLLNKSFVKIEHASDDVKTTVRAFDREENRTAEIEAQEEQLTSKFEKQLLERKSIIASTLPKKKQFKPLVYLIVAILLIALLALVAILSRKKSEELLYLESGTDFNIYEQTQEELELQEPIEFDQKLSEVDLSTLTAQVVYAYNPVTFQVYAEKQSTAKAQIASLTKLMASIIIADTFEMEDQIVMNAPIEKDLEWELELEMGDTLTVAETLDSMLLSSYNDVALIAARAYPDGGEEGFLQEMNSRAQLYGMYDTHFATPYGFDDENNYSTAQDLAKLVAVFLQHEELKAIVLKKTAQITIENGVNVRRENIKTTNWLLNADQFNRGLKTGYTEKAGQCFIGYFDAGGSDQLITIVLNTQENRFDETQSLVRDLRESF